jgi:hypothetical protein
MIMSGADPGVGKGPNFGSLLRAFEPFPGYQFHLVSYLALILEFWESEGRSRFYAFSIPEHDQK